MAEKIAKDRVTGDPRGLTLLEVNARFMKPETYRRLVENVKKDGTLTQEPLVYRHAGLEEFGELEAGTLEVLSGNHRVQASIDAGLETIEWLETERLSPQRRLALQLSHNSIAGEDDPATLKHLYEQLQDVDLRGYAGLDDKTLDLLEKVEVGSLSEANLDFTTVQLVFLPHEKDVAAEALDAAEKTVKADVRWLAPEAMYEPLLDALASAHAAADVKTVSLALLAVLAVFERHLGDLRAEWLDEQWEPRHKGQAPLESLFDSRTMPTEAAATVARALDRMVGRQECAPDAKWQALERWAADYLAGQ